MGGGKISLYLAILLEKMQMQVKIVELSEARCRFLSATAPPFTIICGDGTDQELLDSENLSSCDAFVALTDRDEDNLIISLYAAQLGLSKVITKSNRQNYNRIAQAVGLDSIISPKQLATSHILQVVRGMQNSQGSVMNALYRIADGAAEAMEFTVTASTRHLGTPLRDLSLKPGILVAVVARGARSLPGRLHVHPRGRLCILISRDRRLQDLNDIYDEGEHTFSAPGGMS